MGWYNQATTLGVIAGGIMISGGLIYEQYASKDGGELLNFNPIESGVALVAIAGIPRGIYGAIQTRKQEKRTLLRHLEEIEKTERRMEDLLNKRFPQESIK